MKLPQTPVCLIRKTWSCITKDPVTIAASMAAIARPLKKKGNDVSGTPASKGYNHPEILPSDPGRNVHEETRKARFMCMKCITDGHFEHPNGRGIACDFCYGAFLDLDTLKKHSLQCPEAKEGARSYVRRYKLREHLRRNHNLTEYLEIVGSTGLFFLDEGKKVEEQQEQEPKSLEEGSLQTRTLYRAGISEAPSVLNDELRGSRGGGSKVTPLEELFMPITPINRSTLESFGFLPSLGDGASHVPSNPSFYDANFGPSEYAPASARHKIPTREGPQFHSTPSPRARELSPRSSLPDSCTETFDGESPPRSLTSSPNKPIPSSSQAEPASFDSEQDRQSIQQTSSYWSVPEQNDFPALLKHFGTDWKGMARHMVTKTHIMVRADILTSSMPL